MIDFFKSIQGAIPGFNIGDIQKGLLEEAKKKGAEALKKVEENLEAETEKAIAKHLEGMMKDALPKIIEEAKKKTSAADSEHTAYANPYDFTTKTRGKGNAIVGFIIFNAWRWGVFNVKVLNNACDRFRDRHEPKVTERLKTVLADRKLTFEELAAAVIKAEIEQTF